MANTKKLETLYSTKTGAGTDTDNLSATLKQNADPVNQAWKNLQTQQAKKPGQYQSQYQQQKDDLMSQIQNRKDFSYDLNSDALWNQYKDQYVNLGRQAMMDTMGQAQSMTGGYGNSYAQVAGQQAYDRYIQSLTDKVPELYGMAMDKYQMEGNDLMNRYGLMADQENLDYSRYMDMVNQYYADLDRLQGIYDNERDFQYNKEINDRDYAYQLERDTIEDERWLKEWEEYIRRYNFENKLGEFAVDTPAGGGEEEEKKSSPGKPKPADEEEESNSYDPTFKTVTQDALNEQASGGDPKKTATEAYQAGLITKDQLKSMKYTFGF